jgi:hypothetical protein
MLDVSVSMPEATEYAYIAFQRNRKSNAAVYTKKKLKAGNARRGIRDNVSDQFPFG